MIRDKFPNKPSKIIKMSNPHRLCKSHKTDKLIIVLITILLFISSVAIIKSPAGEGNIIELETVRIVPYYDNYTIDHYLYSGPDCVESNFTQNWSFRVLPHRGIGPYIEPEIARFAYFEPSELLLIPFKNNVMFTAEDFSTTLPIGAIYIPPYGGLIEPDSINQMPFKYSDLPKPAYSDLLKWDEGPYGYRLNVSFRVVELYTGREKTVRFFTLPYSLDGCDYECNNAFDICVDECILGCEEDDCEKPSGDLMEACEGRCQAMAPYPPCKHPGVPEKMVFEISGAVPDTVYTYRDNGDLKKAITSFKFTFRKEALDLLGSIEETVTEELDLMLAGDNSSMFQSLLNIPGGFFSDLADTVGNFASSGFTSLISGLVFGLPVALGDMILNPLSSLPYIFLNFLVTGYPGNDITIDYMKIEYDGSPALPPLVSYVGTTIEALDIFETLENKVKEEIMNFTVIDSDYAAYFKNYHNTTLEYKVKIKLFGSFGGGPEEREIKLEIDLVD